MRISTFPRPYLLTFAASNHAYVVSSEEAQRLIDGNPVVYASRHRVIVQGGNTAKPHDRAVLTAATRDSNHAFLIEKPRHAHQTA